jgi:cell wall-associated NlpC family hydrolase
LARDADEQAAGGTPVAPGQLQPGDLLFYAGAGGHGHIHHVALYAGAGLMIQSPATGRTVETVPADLHGEFWGARRYLPL